MTEDISKQVEFAKSHSTVQNPKGVCIFKGKKILVVGYTHLPLQYRYTSEKSLQYPELHISAVMDAIMKIGSYRRVTYSDLEIAISEEPTLQELSLITEMGFKKLWIQGEQKAVIPDEYFFEKLRAEKIKF